MKLREFFTSPEWIWRHLLLLAMLAQLYMGANYVSRTEYSLDRKDLSVTLVKINETIIDLRMAMKIQERTTEKLSDHETRLRVLEQQRKQ